jgi:flagellar secretion chaperone FliS
MRNPYETHLNEKILCAEPLELVVMLYAGAQESVSSARRMLREGDIFGRSRQIGKAIDIVAELANSLDLKAGPMSEKLADLYLFIVKRLVEANLQQQEQPLIEVEGILKTLGDAWKTCQEGTISEAVAEPLKSDAAVMGASSLSYSYS